MKNKATTPAPRLTLKKERLVCLTNRANAHSGGGRHITTIFTITIIQ